MLYHIVGGDRYFTASRKDCSLNPTQMMNQLVLEPFLVYEFSAFLPPSVSPVSKDTTPSVYGSTMYNCAKGLPRLVQ